MDTDSGLTDDQKQARKEKDLGNTAYKARKFAEAHEHYDKAIALDAKDMTFHTNKAAVYFEEAKYDDAIQTCEKAVEIGRENRADYKLIAKALARIGNSYLKMDKYDEAKIYFDKSLTEHRTPDVTKRANDVAKVLKERAAKAYLDPEKSLEEKAKGNELFKKGKYPEAISHYSEAIKRNPDDPVLYSNRAACYQKLMEFQMAITDSDECLKRDPTFIKGYLRKAAALLAMREFSRASSAYEEALKLDMNNEEAANGLRSVQRELASNPEERRKRALNDPEIQKILGDPAMRTILEQMQQDPRAVNEHLKNPEIREKLMKLIDGGFVEMR